MRRALLGAALLFLCLHSAFAGESRLPADAIERLMMPLRAGQQISLDPMPIADLPDAVLRLERFEVFAPDAKIVARDAAGDHAVPLPAARYFRGKVAGDDDSLVFLSIGDDVRGLITTHGRFFTVGSRRLDSRTVYVVREFDPAQDLRDRARRWRCETTDGDVDWTRIAARTAAASAQSVRPLSASYTAQVAIDTDYELYQLLGGTDAAITSYVSNLVAAVSTISSRDIGISLNVTYVALWRTAQDPWTATDSYSAIHEFRDYWNTNHASVRRHFATFLSGKDLGGGRGFISALCSINAYSVAGNLTGQVNTTDPNLFGDIIFFAHEMGHIFGSPHTQCYNPPVDQCYSGESGCYSGPQSLPAQGGTIMSYCQLLSGGWSNIRLLYGAASEPSQAVINRLIAFSQPLFTTATIAAPASMCAGVSAVASVPAFAPGTLYNWSITNGTITSGATSSTVHFTSGTGGAVQLSVDIDPNGSCGTTATASIPIASTAATSIASRDYACPGSTGNTASVPDFGSGATYSWSITNGTITAGAGSNAVTYTAGTTGSVQFTVNVTTGSCAAAASTSVRIGNPQPVINAPVTMDPYGSASASVTTIAGATYSWSILNGIIDSGNGTPQITFESTDISSPVTLHVTVTDPAGCSATTTKQVSLNTTLTVEDIEPRSGTTAGGDSVIIGGTGFVSGATVAFSGVPATATFIDSRTLRVTTPPNSAGAVFVVVTNPSGDTSEHFYEPVFTYEAPSLQIYRVTANAGYTTGGLSVRIYGDGFAAGATVTFDGVAATNVAVVSAKQITATTPVHAGTGFVDVVVTQGSDSATLAGGFNYVSTSVLVNSVVPNTGPIAGGNSVTVNGSGFVAGTVINFDGTPATGIIVNSSSSITATVPAGSSGPVNVQAVTPSGAASSKSSAYDYYDPQFRITGVDAAGPLAGGQRVRVIGVGLDQLQSVDFDGRPALNVQILSAGEVHVTTPPGIVDGFVPVHAMSRRGIDAWSSVGYNYSSLPGPTITSISPAYGPDSGGTSVTITGSGFLSGVDVRLDNVVLSGVTVVDSNHITASTPAHAAGAVTLAVRNTDLQVASRKNAFTFYSGNAVPGDVNADGTIDAADVFYLISNLFGGGAAPLGNADVNGDGKTTAADVFYLIDYLFAGGPAPV